MQTSRLFRPLLATIFLLAGLAQSAHADIVTITGNTTGGPTFDRPQPDFGDLSPAGAGAHYNAIEFSASQTGQYVFYGTGQFDTFLILYYGFDPSAPLLGGLGANDDLLGNTSSGFSRSLVAGEEYILVMTGFDRDDYGAYSVTISGPGVITAVPEPAAWLMLAVGGLGLALHRRSK